MLIRQSKNSFIRIYDDGLLGQITNQLTRHDRSYNESGADFLAQISREPKSIDDIVNNLKKIYDIDTETIRNDFIEFAQDLAEHKFIVIGETAADLDNQDLDFSYSMENPKTLIDDFTQNTKEEPDKIKEALQYLAR